MKKWLLSLVLLNSSRMARLKPEKATLNTTMVKLFLLISGLHGAVLAKHPCNTTNICSKQIIQHGGIKFVSLVFPSMVMQHQWELVVNNKVGQRLSSTGQVKVTIQLMPTVLLVFPMLSLPTNTELSSIKVIQHQEISKQPSISSLPNEKDIFN